MLNVRIKGLLKSMEVDAIFLKKWEMCAGQADSGERIPTCFVQTNKRSL